MMTSRDIDDFIVRLNTDYMRIHVPREEQFWLTKMGIETNYDAFNSEDARLREFKQDHERLARCREALQSGRASEAAAGTLGGWIRFFEANVVEQEDAKRLMEKIVSMESALEKARAGMDLGYVDPETGRKRDASSVELSLKIVTAGEEGVRKACHEGLETIERFVLDHGFLDIVRERNRVARRLGFEDYYDYKVSTTEGFGKKKLFEWLDELEERTRGALDRLIDDVRRAHGDEAVLPWNIRHAVVGGSTLLLDPYMRFDDAVLRWGRSFTAMGVRFEGATLELDLVQRKGKYENGFCHAPEVPYQDAASRVRARVNFTSNAVPGQAGSGKRAADTLFHEGAHAAHFANILMGAPCFSQEFAPTSAAFAETQSMFFDSLLNDADWLAGYARDRDGGRIPWGVIERLTRETQPIAAFGVRSMMSVCYAEKTLYELPESDLHAAAVLDALRDVERRLHGIERSPRPILSVPHLLAGESSCIYHGYVLAQAGVSQTRRHFLRTFGRLTDCADIGPAMRDVYWRPGNSKPFAEFIREMTGSEFSIDALAMKLSRTPDQAVADQRSRFEAAVAATPFTGPVDLDCTVRMVHGDRVIASNEGLSFETMAERYADWLGSLEHPGR